MSILCAGECSCPCRKAGGIWGQRANLAGSIPGTQRKLVSNNGPCVSNDLEGLEAE